MCAFSGRPCKYCHQGIINPSQYQEVCDYCKIKRRDERMKKMKKIWEKRKKQKKKK